MEMILSQGLIFLPIIASVLIYVFNKKWINYIVFPVQGILTLWIYFLWQHVIDHGILSFTLGGWDRSIAIELSIDHLSLMFMTMAVIIWWVVTLYAWKNKQNDFKFLFFLYFLEGCFLAFLQVNDFFTIFVLMEVITIISTILILYKKDGISVKAGLYYLLFNSFGMVIYLFGVMLLYLKVGTLNMSLIAEYLSTHNLMAAEFSLIHLSFACIFVSMCVKAALFPVYDWLPRAHTAAPSYISALLSGLLVKTGIYGLIRVLSVFKVHEIYSFMFYLGFFTALSGIIFAISQKDIKGILAFSTISQIGMIIMSLSALNDVGMIGAYMHIFNHVLFKSLLFLGAGIIINEYGVRRVTEIRGIARAHPLLTACMTVAILSITGAPLFIGFLSKSMMKLSSETFLHDGLFRLINLGTIVYFIKFSSIFFGKPKRKKTIKKGQLISIVIMTSLMVVIYFVQLDFIPTFMQINGLAMSYELSNAILYIENALYDGYYLLEYILMVMAAYVIYKLVIRPEAVIWHYLRQFRIKFQDAVLLLIIFLIAVLSFI